MSTHTGEEGRPDHLIVVTGTGTEVGKTWMSERITSELVRRGRSVRARKPAQSFDEGTPEAITDAGVLGASTGELPQQVCPPSRWYPTALAPPMAADSLGRDRILVAELVDEIAGSWGRGRIDVGLVELAGGAFSPISHDADCVQMTRALRPDLVVIVADAGLGTISAVRPAVGALSGVARSVVALNRFDPRVEVHARNLRWLREVDGFEVTDTPDALAAAVLDLPARS